MKSRIGRSYRKELDEFLKKSARAGVVIMREKLFRMAIPIYDQNQIVAVTLGLSLKQGVSISEHQIRSFERVLRNAGQLLVKNSK